MDELRRILRIFMDRFFPRTYDYHEYQGGRSPAAPGGGSEEEAKAQKVKILAGIILVAGLPLSFYVYNLRGDYRPNRRAAAAAPSAEAEREEGADPVSLSQQQTLDDLRRWAADVERQAQRGALDTAPPSHGARAGGVSLLPFEEDGEDPWAAAAAPSRRERNPLRDTTPLFPEFAPPPATPAPPAPAAPLPPPEPPRAIEAAPPAPSPAAAPAVDAATEPETPYHRRRYEPIAVDPRAVDPY